MDWRTEVELFEEIRREYEFGEGTIKGVARKLGVQRRMVREASRKLLWGAGNWCIHLHWGRTEKFRSCLCGFCADFA